jgi:hypothetical protein
LTIAAVVVATTDRNASGHYVAADSLDAQLSDGAVSGVQTHGRSRDQPDDAAADLFALVALRLAADIQRATLDAIALTVGKLDAERAERERRAFRVAAARRRAQALRRSGAVDLVVFETREACRTALVVGDAGLAQPASASTGRAARTGRAASTG